MFFSSDQIIIIKISPEIYKDPSSVSEEMDRVEVWEGYVWLGWTEHQNNPESSGVHKEDRNRDI